MKKANFLNIAHRGASGDAPENTLAAFKLAVEHKADAIELDINLSSDGEVFVCHDATVDRTSNGKGAFAKLSSAEIKKLDAGSWFGEKFTGEPFPLLSEVFELVPSHILINVEIKMMPEYDGKIQPKLAELMRKYDRVDNVVVSSFHHGSLDDLLRLLPEAKIGLLTNYPIVKVSRYAENFVKPVYSLHPAYKWVSAGELDEAEAHGLQVYTWTINDVAQMEKYMEMGVNGIITNYPGKLAELK